MNREVNRTNRRDKMLATRKYGMRVSGKGFGSITKSVIVKRCKEYEGKLQT